MIARIFFFRAAPVFFHLLLFGCRGGTSTGLDAGPEDTGISLVVQSTPEGATILLDGEYVGTTPDTLTELAQGNYVLGLSLSGYSDYSTHLVIRDSTVGPVAATLSALCSGQVIGDPARPAEIEFTDLNPGDRRVRGSARNVDASSVRVVLWALTNIWYVQPFIASPYTEICDDGSWDSSTHAWKNMVVLLVDSTYTPGSVRYTHPAFEDGVVAFAQFPSLRSDLPLDFSGRQWGVKQSADRFDPGPNYWSASEENIWIDPDGMHLSIRNDAGNWMCPEVYLLESLGYGVYTFEITGRIDSLDPNTVFGCFAYESSSRELDVEFSAALASPDNAQFVAQPYTRSGNILRFEMPALTASTHQIEWRPEFVTFRSWRGFSTEEDSLIASWDYTGPDIPPPGGERWRFNLWLHGGRAPDGGLGDEVVIRHFHYAK